MKQKVNPMPRTESEREELIRLHTEIEYIQAENEVIKKDRLERKKRSCATQGEKAAYIKELKNKGYQLKHLLKAMELPKSTYYYELDRVDTV